MDFEKHTRKSIDGFSGGNADRRALFKSSSDLSGFKRPVEKKSIKPTPVKASPKVTPSYAVPQQTSPSLLNMNIPNPSYSRTPYSSRGKKGTKKSWSRKRKVVTSILTVVIILFAFTGWFGSRIIGSLDKVFHGNIFSDATALFSSSDLRGESSGRVNILVAGDSADDPGHSGAILTDSIMVVSLDTKNHTGFMLSIPRDLWVYVPGMNSYQKINAANTVSKFSAPGYPSGGMGQLQQIVQNNLGIPIDYYALVNYSAFKDAVNSVGGITINVNSPDPRGLFDAYTNLKLPNGEDNLNGQMALNLARARGDGAAGDVYYGFPNSDFTRTMYQREMGVAILKKATSIGVVSNPLKISSLFNSFSNNVQTNLNLQNVLALDQLTKSLNLSQLGSYSYSSSVDGNNNPLLIGYRDPKSGQDALIPTDGIGNFAGMKAYYQMLSSSNPVTKEDASVEILNGSNVTGLAKQVQESYQSKGISNVAIADTIGSYDTSLIVSNSNGKAPNTLKLLQQANPGAAVVTSPTVSPEAKEAAKYSQYNFVVILGQNFANSNPVASSTSSTTTNTYSSTSNTGSYTGSNN